MPQISKVIYGNTTLIDLTSDTVVASALQSGFTAHSKDGTLITGNCTWNVDARDANAAAGEILFGQTAYVGNSKITGQMANNSGWTGTIASRDSAVSVPVGYHDGSGSVSIDSSEKAKLIADNIREGVVILGITGTMSGSEDVKATNITAVAYTTSKTYLPSDQGDFNYFSQFSVSSIAYSTTTNTAGGWTATIGTVAPA